jgi:hypothetical protein
MPEWRFSFWRLQLCPRGRRRIAQQVWIQPQRCRTNEFEPLDEHRDVPTVAPFESQSYFVAAARTAAQRFFVASMILCRPSALSLRFGFLATGLAVFTPASGSLHRSPSLPLRSRDPFPGGRAHLPPFARRLGVAAGLGVRIILSRRAVPGAWGRHRAVNSRSAKGSNRLRSGRLANKKRK